MCASVPGSFETFGSLFNVALLGAVDLSCNGSHVNWWYQLCTLLVVLYAVVFRRR